MPRKVQQNEKSERIGPYDFQERAFKDTPTFRDYANLSTLMATLPLTVVHQLFRRQLKYIFGGDVRNTWGEAIWQQTMDHFAYNCSWRQLRILSPLRPLRVELKALKIPGLPGYNGYFGGTNYSARWLCEVPDRTNKDPVILYLHGGSYALKTQKPQLEYMASIARMTKSYRTSVLILDYTIGPFAKYPTQLNEAMACYEELKQSCDNIIVLGDSCGGHLALTMLLSGARFSGGLLLISPSTDMTNDEPEDVSMREVFVDTNVHELTDPMISPLYADPKVWPKILPEHTAIVWGGAELCKPQMIEWARLAEVHAQFEEPGGSHDCILRGTKNQGSKFIQSQLLSWLESNKST